jgi:hypothetical protein
MGILKAIASAALTLTLLALIGCGAMMGKPPAEGPPASRPTGVETPQDAALSKAVKERLAADKAVNLSPVIVEARTGTVYLSGRVPSLDAREQATKISWQVTGVKTVVNHLEVGK